MKLPAKAAAPLVSLACLICPLVECFDRWDHTPQTGNDTEFVFMILALCLGAACILARLIGSVWFAGRYAGEDGHCKAPRSPRPFFNGSTLSLVSITVSPPFTALRI